MKYHKWEKLEMLNEKAFECKKCGIEKHQSNLGGWEYWIFKNGGVDIIFKRPNCLINKL